MKQKWTRREIARWGLAIPVLFSRTGVNAQTAAAADAATDPFAKARAGNKAHSETLAKIEMPMSTEPAFVFRA